jgi:hypothetical protein
MIQPPTPPAQSLFPPHPQIFYWGYPSGPISPTYFGPLQIPTHPFPHFAPDRPPALVSWKLSFRGITSNNTYLTSHLFFPFFILTHTFWVLRTTTTIVIITFHEEQSYRLLNIQKLFIHKKIQFVAYDWICDTFITNSSQSFVKSWIFGQVL